MTKTRYACGIPDGNQFIVTGGVSRGRNIDNVHVYDTNGWIRDLPSLNIARSDHACASFIANGQRVSLKHLHMNFVFLFFTGSHITYYNFSFYLLLEAGVHSIRPSLMRLRSSLSPRPVGGPSLLGCLSLSMFRKQSALTIKSCFLVKTML